MKRIINYMGNLVESNIPYWAVLIDEIVDAVIVVILAKGWHVYSAAGEDVELVLVLDGRPQRKGPVLAVDKDSVADDEGRRLRGVSVVKGNVERHRTRLANSFVAVESHSIGAAFADASRRVVEARIGNAKAGDKQSGR